MRILDFEAVRDFEKSLDEVDVLIKIANGYRTLGKSDKQSLILRAAILFLGTHLECFFEGMAEEYVFKVEQLAIPRDKMPTALLMSSVDYLLTEGLIKKIRSKNPNCTDALVNLAKILSCDSPVTNLEVDTSFSYGKHGSGIVESLFKRLDVSNLFQNSPVYVEVESMLSDEPERDLVDIKSKFDSLTGVRNALIHEYTTPNQITINNILSDIPHYKSFGRAVEIYLNQKLDALEILKV